MLAAGCRLVYLVSNPLEVAVAGNDTPLSVQDLHARANADLEKARRELN